MLSQTFVRSGGAQPGAYHRAVLTPRQELLLRKVVEAYTATGLPVGSKALAADPEVCLLYTSDAADD